MTVQTVSLSALEASAANPRRRIDRKTIEGLAASIRTDGLLHNLVVSPLEGKKKDKRFRIVSGARRYAALRLLEERGELPEGFTVPVEIRADLSKDDTLRIATVENLQRQSLTPLVETAALTRLIHKGVTLDAVVAQTGLSSTTIKRRLALNSLCKEAKQVLTKNEISLSQAEALTLGGHEIQQRMLEDIARGYECSAEDIRATLLDDRPTVALAIFPAQQYKGKITTDLFADDETSYFDDAEQFLALQKEAVAQLVKYHEASAAWVDLTESYSIQDWQYRKASKREKSGVLINLSPSGRVEVRESLARRKVDKETAKEVAGNPVAPVKAAYSKPLCQYIAHQKSAAVAEMLFASRRMAQEVMATHMLARFKLHPAFTALAKEAEPQNAYRVLEAQARQFAAKLGFAIEDAESVWTHFPPSRAGANDLYEAVKGLSDHDLTMLQTLLTVLSFGQVDCDRLDTQDSLLNRVARDLGIDMRSHWRPDGSFLAKRNREQLVGIARDCGYADGNGSVASYKKSELVSCLIRYFQTAQATNASTEAQQKARDWLPDSLLFPAVDPNGPIAPEQDEADEDEIDTE
jgi:ParB family transcriptional regulator, chromosome partitioning protein